MRAENHQVSFSNRTIVVTQVFWNLGIQEMKIYTLAFSSKGTNVCML